MRKQLSRRHFLSSTCAGAAVLTAPPKATSPAARAIIQLDSKPALLGGVPVRTQPFPDWPVIGAAEEKGLLDTLHSRKWNRLNGGSVMRFENAWTERLGVKHALATASGTSALVCALHALDIGPGDEVIVPPYTFVATINVVLLQHALPVFVDTDLATFQIDASKIEAAITKRTRAILPVHLGGAAANLDAILAVANKYKLPVIEDACQSHLAEWHGRKVGTLGALGCFSLQASKNLNSGEGGVVVTNEESLMESCRSFHNQGRGGMNTSLNYVRNGDNRRLTEFQGALLLAQLTRLEEQARTRETNAAHLTKLLNEIPGIAPAVMYEGCTRNAYHLYMFRYNAAQFSGLPRATFLKALRAEGIPCSGGYDPLNKEPFLNNTLDGRGYRYIYPPKVLQDLKARNARLPQNDQLCQEAVWLTQNMLLGTKEDMDQIAAAIHKLQQQAAQLTKA